MAPPLSTSLEDSTFSQVWKTYLVQTRQEIQVIIKHIKRCSTSLVVPFLIHHVGKNGSLKVLRTGNDVETRILSHAAARSVKQSGHCGEQLAISGKFEHANSSFVLRSIPRETLAHMLGEMCTLWCARASLYQLLRPENVQLFLTRPSVMSCPQLEISQGGSIYTTEISKHHKPGLFPPQRDDG